MKRSLTDKTATARVADCLTSIPYSHMRAQTNPCCKHILWHMHFFIPPWIISNEVDQMWANCTGPVVNNLHIDTWLQLCTSDVTI